MSTLGRWSLHRWAAQALPGHAPGSRTLIGVPEASLTFPAELDSVGAARRFLRATLLGWGNASYDFAAPLVLTELVTNATLHAQTPYTVRLRLEPGRCVPVGRRAPHGQPSPTTSAALRRRRCRNVAAIH